LFFGKCNKALPVLIFRNFNLKRAIEKIDIRMGQVLNNLSVAYLQDSLIKNSKESIIFL